MEKVTGMGGFFFRSREPEALGAWYARHLGLEGGPAPWMQEAGPTVFAPFREDSDYFAADRRWMLNLRVRDLDAMLAQLRAADIAVETRPDWNHPEVGRFARIHDPEGNPIELWEPASQDDSAE
jgi:catechol 2,3-dioxygenase-like lactoylglutathione lyase family enzyme